MIPAELAKLARLTRLDRVVVHHSGTHREVSIAALTRGHLAKGYDAIGYHALVMGDGFLAPGRPLPLEGAHAPPWNRSSIGLCIVGDNTVPAHAWTALQLETARRYLAALEHVIGQELEVYGHRDVGHPTACPGLDRASLLALLERD